MNRKLKTPDQTWEDYQKYVKEHAIKEYELPWILAGNLADVLVNGKLAKHGSFVRALLQNNLIDVYLFADECNWNNLAKICNWIEFESHSCMHGRYAMDWQGLKNMEEE